MTTTTTNHTMWKDLIHIPEHRSTFVLKLTEGLDNAQQTIDEYVVTPSLVDHFDQALTMIDAAMKSQQSQGAFLHGSFGSGKSHFMAVLNLILKNAANARSMEKLTDVIVKHAWMKDRNFLMIPYHMIGATSMEAAILGGYVDYVEKHHPEARTPGVYLADSIFDNADKLRTGVGDEKFFEMLNSDLASTPGRWGKMGLTWNAETYNQARNADAKNASREKLVGDIVRNILPAFRDTARVATDQQFVSFDEGLSIISRHAKELGYDGLILFLDELILWLSNRKADEAFVRAEVAKVPKLVESQHADRPIPIISFIARQRDLKEMLGSAMVGSDRSQLGFSLEWWQGRFQTITLEDRNLPVIASERLLRPKNQSAREVIRQSFEQFARTLQSSSKDTMLTSKHSEKDFALIFPFSPALVESLIVLSSTLQRERTALKLMQSLLIKQRDTLQLGQIIPVGSLWDVIADGEEPIDDTMRNMMRTARRLWTNRLRPALVRIANNVDPEEPGSQATPADLARFQSNAGLVKTLLVAALVPTIEVFEELTAARLVALNHGSIQTPIAAAAPGIAIQTLRKIASEITEISIEGTSNPVIKLRLDDVDIEPLLRQADSADSLDERRRKVKDLLFKWLDISEKNTLRAEFSIDWRGGKRTAQVIYENTRTLPDDRLTSHADDWVFIFDYPFDDVGFTPADDAAALEQYLERHPQGTNTISWIPSFLNESGQNLLGRLLKIEDVRARFNDYTVNIRPDDRGIAKILLDNAHRSVESRLVEALRTAYGLSTSSIDLIDESNKAREHIHALRPGLKPATPIGVEFHQALENVFTEALQFQYPKAYAVPDAPPRSRDLQAVFDVIRTALENSERRAYVETSALRKQVGNITEPLRLGVQGDTHFHFQSDWPEQIHRQLKAIHNIDAADSNARITVGDIYAILDSPENPTGLPTPFKDLIVLTYAEVENMLFSRRGQEVPAEIGALRTDDLLERHHLPDETAWNRASLLAQTIFGITPPRVRNARAVQQLAGDITKSVQEYKTAGRQIAGLLTQVAFENLAISHLEVATFKRHEHAVKMRQILDATDRQEPGSVLEALAACDIGEHDASAVLTSLKTAPKNLAIFNNPSLWQVIRNFANKSNLSQAETGLLDEVHYVLSQPEHATPLSELNTLQSRIIELTFSSKPEPKPEPKPDPITPPIIQPPVIAPERQHTLTANPANRSQAVNWLQEQLTAHAGKKITISIQVEDE